MKKVAVIGHFAFGKEFLDGQTVKTKIVTKELENQLGEQEVSKEDTHGGKSKLLKLPFVVFKVLKNHKNILIFPAENGVRIIAPMLVLGNIFFHRKLHYIVIGGWLPKLLEKRAVLAYFLKKIDCIYVETNIMKSSLIKNGFSNIEIMPNCKELNIVKDQEIECLPNEPFRLCTFSRVMKEKGIEDAIEAICFVNDKYKRKVFSLDIYGPVDPMQETWFEELMETVPEYITYHGAVPFDKSVDILKKYYALLFPTRFYTEGIPGTIIDSYAAGIPVISSRWESFSDMIEENKTGLGYEFLNVTELKERLLEIMGNPELVNSMKMNCLLKAENFIPQKAMQVLTKRLK